MNARAAAAAPRTPTEARFARALGTSPCARTDHFMLHHVGQTQLSTGDKSGSHALVDESASSAAPWLGLVVPKRHARRSVTRNLMRRQMRACFARHAGALPGGDWVLRLRKGYERELFPSAASDALAERVARELAQLLDRARRSALRAPAAAPSVATS